MSEAKDLLVDVLDNFSNIVDILSERNDIELQLLTITDNKSSTEVLEKAKGIVDKLYEHTKDLKTSFYKKYHLLNNANAIIEENNVSSEGDNLHTDYHDTDNEDPLQSNKECTEESTLNTSDGKTDKNNKKDSLVSENESDDKTSKRDTPQIKLVDINKLVAPKTEILHDVLTTKPKKSVKFDSSVIILTSSDEESPHKKPKKEPSPIKSVLKKSSDISSDAIKLYTSDSDSKENHENNSRKSKRFSKQNNDFRNHSSDSDSKENHENDSRRSRRLKNESAVKQKFSQLVEKRSERSSSEKAKIKLKTISNASGSDEESDDSDAEVKDNKLAKKIKDKLEKANKRKSKLSSPPPQTEDSSSEEEIPLSTLKSKSPEENNKNSDSDNEQDKTTKKSEKKDSKNAKKSTDTKVQTLKQGKKKKELLEESDLSETSLSDNESAKKPKKTSTGRTLRKRKPPPQKIDENDLKFRSEVYISLPRYECEKLPEIYLEKKELFEIKRLCKIKLRPKRTRSNPAQEDSPNNSDDDDTPDKPENKKIKLTLKRKPQEDKQTDKENDSDNDSNGGMDSYEVMPEVDKNMGDDGEDVLADGVALQQSGDEKVSDDESDNGTADKSNKKKRDKKISPVNKKNKKSNDNDNEDENSDVDDKTDKKSEDSKESDEKDKKGKKETKKKEKTDSGEEEKSEDGKKDGSDKEDEESGDEKNKKKGKKNWQNDKLLKSVEDSSDSEEDFSKYSKRKDKSQKEIQSDDEVMIFPNRGGRKASKRLKKKKQSLIDSDSDENSKDKKSSADESEDKASDNSDSENSDKSDKAEKTKPKRRRIKRAKDSSSDDEDKSTRKQIRRVLDRDSLSETTKQAEAAEKERKARIAEKQKKYNQLFELKTDAVVDKVVLDYDEKTEKELMCINKKMVKVLKPHQISGVKFMWDACFESLKRAKEEAGSGCILAHCMGLGKTLQVITLCHTLLSESEKTKVEKILVVCPINTVLNWKEEFKRWLPKNHNVEVYELISCKQNVERQYVVKDWHENGGVLIIGYAMFRLLSNPDNKKISKKLRTAFNEGLVDPGPDLVICDEGHLLKNEKTNLSIAMNRIKTARRIVLTGTPLQNNLKEYWCMVQFIKPNLLGTYKEYLNRFVNPITNGQYTDSTAHDIQIMRRRSHVLHKLLDGVVQRRDYAVLAPYLPPKHEYVLMINLTEVQVKMYKHYMDKFARRSDGSNRTSFLFTDFQELQRICTHPRALLEKRSTKEKELDDDSEGSLKDFIDDGSDAASSSSGGSSSGSESGASDDSRKKSKKKPVKTRLTRAQAAQKRLNGDNEEESDIEDVEVKEWWQEYCDGEELDNLNHSGKMFLLFQILKECEQIGDKILVFSQSLITLNCIEYFLEKIDEATQEGDTERVGNHTGSWALGLDYFRLDGSSSCDNRATWCNAFNNPENTRARLFLISTKAGGLGINLVAANRVIIFDVSWNPSHDIQSIYRVYRFGQTKPSYVYRFVAYGTMEMKIYERQVTKQAISKRVIDEQQIDRHYSQNDIQELYKIDLEPQDRPIPLVPKDVLLGEMLQKYEKNIYKYHEHQSLLENKEEEGLNEEERKAAWEEFENEKIIRKSTTFTGLSNFNLAGNNVTNFSPQAIQVALANIVRKDNPTWSEVQVKGIVPALVQQLQVQLSEGELTMYKRVEQEIQLMQAMHAQKLREQYYQQQVMRMIQQQQAQQKMLGSMQINPGHLSAGVMGGSGAKLNSSLQDYLLGRASQQNSAVAGTSRAKSANPNEVIELN